MKSTLILAIFLILSICTISNGQEDGILTDGIEDYWHPSERQLGEIFTSEFWAPLKEKHHKELHHTPLFVRFDDAATKIAALKKHGRTETAQKLEQKIGEMNRYIVNYMKDNYEGSEYYFYYGKDARAIFVDKDYTFLYESIDVKTKNRVTVGKDISYVLMYQTLPPMNSRKAFSLHVWDKERIYKVKDHIYKPFFTLDFRKGTSLRIFCKKVRQAKS